MSEVFFQHKLKKQGQDTIDAIMQIVSNSWNLCPSLALYNHKKIDLHHDWQTEIEVRSQRETIGTLDILDKDFQIG